MVNEELVAIDEFCASRNVEIAFVQSLSEAGLLETIKIEETSFISVDQLPELDKLVRFHYDMDINLEGIETIYHLLQQMKTMQKELSELKGRLSLYERSF